MSVRSPRPAASLGRPGSRTRSRAGSARRSGPRSSARPSAPAARPPGARPCPAWRRRPISAASTTSRELGFPGEYPYTRGIQPTMYRGRLWTMRQYAGFGTGGRDQPAVPLPPRGRGRRACRWRSTCRPRWATTRTPPRRAARSAGSACRSRASTTWPSSSRDLPARPRLDLDDDQRHRRHPARALPGGGRAPGGRPRRRSPAPCRTTS